MHRRERASTLPEHKVLQLRPADVKAEEWCALLGQDVYSPQGHILATVVSALRNGGV